MSVGNIENGPVGTGKKFLHQPGKRLSEDRFREAVSAGREKRGKKHKKAEKSDDAALITVQGPGMARINGGNVLESPAHPPSQLIMTLIRRIQECISVRWAFKSGFSTTLDLSGVMAGGLSAAITLNRGRLSVTFTASNDDSLKKLRRERELLQIELGKTGLKRVDITFSNITESQPGQTRERSA